MVELRELLASRVPRAVRGEEERKTEEDKTETVRRRERRGTGRGKTKVDFFKGQLSVQFERRDIGQGAKS